MEHGGGVVAAAVDGAQRRAHHEHGVEPGGEPGQLGQARLGAGQQVGRQEQVLARVAGEGELGEHHERGAVGHQPVGPGRHLDGVGRRVGQVHRRGGGRHPDEAVTAPVDLAHAPEGTGATVPATGRFASDGSNGRVPAPP